METTRILNPPRTVDPYYHQAERMAALDNRLALLERQQGGDSNKFARSLTGATNIVLLPVIDDARTTGVRISFAGVMLGAGVGTATPCIRLKPNGLTSMLTQTVAQREYTPGPTYTPTADNGYGGAFASTAGLIVAQKSWAATNGDELVTFDGVFYVKRNGVNDFFSRTWDGTYTARDITVDGNRMMTVRVMSTFQQVTVAPITSLNLSVDAGSVTGRVSVEILP